MVFTDKFRHLLAQSTCPHFELVPVKQINRKSAQLLALRCSSVESVNALVEQQTQHVSNVITVSTQDNHLTGSSVNIFHLH